MNTSEKVIAKGKNELFGDVLKIIIPEAERQSSSIKRSFVDTGVWLVGISTAGLALLIGSENESSVLETWSYTWGILLFSAVVLLGVLQKIVYHIAELKQLPISVRFRAGLLAYLDTNRIAIDYQDNWSVEYTVRRLREDFGVDYSFLLSNGASTERAKKAYEGQLEIHRKWEEKGLASLANLICVHTGISREGEKTYFEPGGEAANEKIRSNAQKVNLIYKCADYIYFAAALFFVCAIGILSIGAI